MKVKVEFTKSFSSYKKGDVIELSRDISNIHLKTLKTAKLYVEKKKQSEKVKEVE